jgi:hypothetical protein
MEDQLTPSNMQLNELEPPGFTAEPRVLSHEVWEMRREVAAMREALLRLVEVVRELQSTPHRDGGAA